MKERIQSMINLLKSEKYDPEDTHILYDSILEDYIKSVPDDLEQEEHYLMLDLINIRKDFWYA